MEPSYPSYNTFGGPASSSSPGGCFPTPSEQPFMAPSESTYPATHPSFSSAPCQPAYNSFGGGPVSSSYPGCYPTPSDQPYVTPSGPSYPAACSYPSSDPVFSAEPCPRAYSTPSYQPGGPTYSSPAYKGQF